jgi:hypothetical protein
MMPGLPICQSIAGAIRLSVAGAAADPALGLATLALTFKAAFVVGSIAIGLLLGASTVRLASVFSR